MDVIFDMPCNTCSQLRCPSGKRFLFLVQEVTSSIFESVKQTRFSTTRQCCKTARCAMAQVAEVARPTYSLTSKVTKRVAMSSSL